jgi:site-specific recombinase XerD
MTGTIAKLFIHSDAKARHLSAPLIAEREAYLAHLLKAGYKRRVCVERAAILLHCVRLLGANTGNPVSEAQIESAAMALANERPRSDRVKLQSSFRASARSWCKFLGTYTGKVKAGGRFSSEFEDFTAAMSHELRYLPATSRSCGPAVGDFLSWASGRVDALDVIPHFDIDAYLDEKRAAGWAHRTCINQVRSLRVFFRYAATRGWVASNFSTTLRVPRNLKPHARVKGPPWMQVRQMIGSLDPGNACHCRAKAILLLVSVYGLRRSELVRITLDDFDWPNAVMTVRRSKRGRVQQFPLTNEVGGAIIQYLREVRPSSRHRELFLTLHAPHRPAISLGTAMRKIINSRGVFERPWGLHALRHACATELLRKGTSLRGIADFLGHRSLQSVSIYAHCDYRALRRVGNFNLSGVL